MKRIKIHHATCYSGIRRRDFWLQTDYYKRRMVGNSKADAAMLDELINNIQFTPGDFTRHQRQCEADC